MSQAERAARSRWSIRAAFAGDWRWTDHSRSDRTRSPKGAQVPAARSGEIVASVVGRYREGVWTAGCQPVGGSRARVLRALSRAHHKYTADPTNTTEATVWNHTDPTDSPVHQE